METKRTRFGIVEVLAVGGIVVFLFLAWRALTTNPRVSKENYERIKLGMTSAEVEAILGTGRRGRSCVPPFKSTSKRWDLYLLKRGPFISVSFGGAGGTADWKEFYDGTTPHGVVSERSQETRQAEPDSGGEFDPADGDQPKE